jgi:hypothetical protein
VRFGQVQVTRCSNSGGVGWDFCDLLPKVGSCRPDMERFSAPPASHRTPAQRGRWSDKEQWVTAPRGGPSRGRGQPPASQLRDKLSGATFKDPQESLQSILGDEHFYFQHRQGKIDLDAIAAVDLDRVIENTDVDTLQHHLENLTFSDLNEHDIQVCSDSQFLKLFQLSQLTIEYLLNVQDKLASHSDTMETELRDIKAESSVIQQKVRNKDLKLQELKRDVRQKRKTIATYEMLLRQQPSMPEPNPDDAQKSRSKDGKRKTRDGSKQSRGDTMLSRLQTRFARLDPVGSGVVETAAFLQAVRRDSKLMKLLEDSNKIAALDGMSESSHSLTWSTIFDVITRAGPANCVDVVILDKQIVQISVSPDMMVGDLKRRACSNVAIEDEENGLVLLLNGREMADSSRLSDCGILTRGTSQSNVISIITAREWAKRNSSGKDTHISELKSVENVFEAQMRAMAALENRLTQREAVEKRRDDGENWEEKLQQMQDSMMQKMKADQDVKAANLEKELLALQTRIQGAGGKTSLTSAAQFMESDDEDILTASNVATKSSKQKEPELKTKLLQFTEDNQKLKAELQLLNKKLKEQEKPPAGKPQAASSSTTVAESEKKITHMRGAWQIALIFSRCTRKQLASSWRIWSPGNVLQTKVVSKPKPAVQTKTVSKTNKVIQTKTADKVDKSNSGPAPLQPKSNKPTVQKLRFSTEQPTSKKQALDKPEKAANSMGVSLTVIYKVQRWWRKMPWWLAIPQQHAASERNGMLVFPELSVTDVIKNLAALMKVYLVCKTYYMCCSHRRSIGARNPTPFVGY